MIMQVEWLSVYKQCADYTTTSLRAQHTEHPEVDCHSIRAHF